MLTALVTIIIMGILWFVFTNTGVVTVQLFLWNVSASLALVISVTFLMGFIFGMIRLVPGFWHHRTNAKKINITLDMVKKERDELKKRSEMLEGQIRDLTPKKDPLQEHKT
ncbi:hypothetical protein COU49_01515 [Candidatus Nomurabacteria bacterium CG10_big_fil_rev_8_21_14_0_10_35_16]|uniref:Lipopolysaccharide assembly protein A domain-containing protein n=1 Tax=Candidatus Nomurabacteria bacterium CG10_big_fil_rev_8_21_14_0_10_35_16 TaxID=1974731 RepID=A0A2H0TBL4_9BACT|nr:MAG: hypothetical protein COU49_01515 [Candidatus Nomurabacteria bacterium CG10_big_fil_rev_8_21_14_0_10_35_16]